MSIKRTVSEPLSFSGLSTDEKPITYESGFGEAISTLLVPDLSSFYEFDTAKTYIYSEVNVNPLNSTHWWEV